LKRPWQDPQFSIKIIPAPNCSLILIQLQRTPRRLPVLRARAP
jgi:hypothetical protein